MSEDKIVNGNVIKLDGKNYRVEVMPLTKDDIDNRRSARINFIELPIIENIDITFKVVE